MKIKLTETRKVSKTSILSFVFLSCFTVLLTLPTAVHADICGCANHPNSLGAFDASDSTTWPPGSTSQGSMTYIPLPDDGILIFDSFYIPNNRYVTIIPNAANTPAKILVSGNFRTEGRSWLSVSGENGTSSLAGGFGGKGGPGGFLGGNGAFQMVTGDLIGGAGLGPGGGSGVGGLDTIRGIYDNTHAYLWTLPPGGTNISPRNQYPLIGGNGGGGGASALPDSNCRGGGGGGGGGSLLLAVNGIVNLNSWGVGDGLRSNGGAGGGRNCYGSTSGTGGSGGSIRIIADTVTTPYAHLVINATGGYPGGGTGIIRIEANNINLPNTTGLALVPSPGPLTLPTSTVKITTVNGQAVPNRPAGVFGGVDVHLASTSNVLVDLESQKVPLGTEIVVTAKALTGGDVVATTAVVDSAFCDQAKTCTVSATLNLTPGMYFLEAEATFMLVAQ